MVYRGLYCLILLRDFGILHGLIGIGGPVRVYVYDKGASRGH